MTKTCAVIIIAFSLLIDHPSRAQSSDSPRQIANIEAFARLYGYVRYFHPADEAANINWTDFLWYGIGNVRDAADNTELLQRLNTLFKPIAPSVQIFKTGTPDLFSPDKLIPANVQKYKVIAWQHLGYGDGGNPEYQSRRTNRTYHIAGRRPGTMQSGYGRQIFARIPIVGECAEKELADGITCRVPLALYGTGEATYPAANKAAFAALQQEIKGIIGRVNHTKTVSTTEQFAAVIYTWNVLKHFYPYRTAMGAAWDQELTQAVAAIVNKTDQPLRLEKMLASLTDGHILLNFSTLRVTRTLPAAVSLVEGKLVFTSLDTAIAAKGISRGDELLEINSRPALALLDTLKKKISGTTQWKTVSGLRKLFNGPENTYVILKIRTAEGIKDIQLLRNQSTDTRDSPATAPSKLREGIYYINLDNTPMPKIKKALPDLAKAKGIICDLRGYPNNNEDFLRYLLNRPDTSRHLYTPEIIYPDFQNVTWQREGWDLKPASPHLNAKLIFLTGPTAISYAEGYLGMVKSYQLGTIIGQTTAGANGDQNSLTVPFTRFVITFTGLVATQPDGSPLQGIGIKPDVAVSPTIKGIRAGRDELLEKALEILGRTN